MKKATRKKVTGKRRLANRKAMDFDEDALARDLADVEGFDKGRILRAQIIELGERIRELREKVLHLSQTQAAKLIGMDQPELSRIENGVGARGPSYSTITRIIDAYQEYLQSQNQNYHLGLSIQLRRADTDEVQQDFLAGSA